MRVEASLDHLTQMHVSTQHSIRALAAEVADVRAQLSKISQSEIHTDEARLSGLDIDLLTAEQANSVKVGDLLDLAADFEVQSYVVRDVAERSIQSDDAFVRASAARALAATDPARASELLPDLVSAETNATAKAIMQAALRSVSA